MKIKDLKNEIESKSIFLYMLLFKRFDPDGKEKSKIMKICRKAETASEFCESFLKIEPYSQTAREIYKAYFPEKLWYAIREAIGENRKYAAADIGCLRIGNDDFSVFINNGHGDGLFRYAVYENKPDFSDLFDPKEDAYFSVSKQNSVYVYNYDCEGGKPVETLISGKWYAHSYKGIVILYRV